MEIAQDGWMDRRTEGQVDRLMEKAEWLRVLCRWVHKHKDELTPEPKVHFSPQIPLVSEL